MFSKRSRYYKFDDIAFPDRGGVERQCKAIRRLPLIQGQFLHTLDAGDRLDHLAYKYYRQSLHWWRICDANPESAPPQALVDKAPDKEIRINLIWSGGLPPLAELYEALHHITGIQSVFKGGENGLPEIEISDSPALFTLPGALQTQLDEAARLQTLPPALDTALQGQGLVLPAGLRFTKPAEALWHIDVESSGVLYRLRYSTDTTLITVNTGLVQYEFALFIKYNKNSISRQQIIDAVTALGFAADDVQPQARIGANIVIPPRYTGKN